MKVIQITCGFSYSTVYNKLFSELKRKNIQPEVYVPQHKNKVVEDVIYDEFPFHIYSSRIIKAYDKLLYYTKIRRMVKDVELNFNLSEISLIHSHSLFSDGAVALSIYQKYKIPYIVAIRDTDINKYFKYGIHLRKFALKILKNAKKVIFISPEYRNYVTDKYLPTKFKDEILGKTIVIPNGIDEYWLNNSFNNKEYKIVDNPGKNHIKLIFVGAINKRKNIISIVNSIEKLEEKGYKAKLTVVGRIEDYAIYKQIIDSPYVNYIKPKSKEELINIYRQNHIFVMPSITETFGLTYAEAMSQGLPVIYSKGQGFDGQFEEGVVGYHVDCFNSEEISEKIIEIINNYEGIAKNCVRMCNKFDWKIITKEYKKIYDDNIQ